MMMLYGAATELTTRMESDGTRILSGRFPYNKTATLSDGGRRNRPRKEKFAPKAFEFRVDKPDEDIHLLVGHDFDKPLASKLSDTLTLTDTLEALLFEARILPNIAETQHGRDILALLTSGLAVGLSPGFRIPPERAVKDAESVEQEPDDGQPDANGDPQRGAIIRTIISALLFELSIVTRPAFDEAQVEERSWRVPARVRSYPIKGLMFAPAYRWRHA